MQPWGDWDNFRIWRYNMIFYKPPGHIIIYYMKASGKPAMAIDRQDNTKTGTSKLLPLRLIWRARMPIYRI